MASTLELLTAAQMAFQNNVPAATLYMTSAWSPSSGTTGLTVPWNASAYDNWAGHSNSTNNTRYTVQVAGVYAVSAAVCWTGNATGLRISELWKNGSMLPGTEIYEGADGTNNVTVVNPPYLVQCAVGDYLEVNGYQNSGGSLATVTSSCYFTVEFVHF